MVTERPDKIYLFGTCLIDLLYPDAGISALRLIEREGVQVIFPQDQSCCGQPAWNSGYREQALAVARQQLTLFKEPIPVVIPSGSCAGMVRLHYPELFAGEFDETEALALASRTFELTEFLVDILQVELTDLGPPTKVVLHTSCATRRELGAVGRSFTLLDQLEGVEAVEPDYHAECCGFGGTFAVKQPEISAAMVSDKAEAVIASGADRLISQDSGCLMNISGTLEKQGRAISSQHIAQFLWERTGEEQ